MLLDQLVASGWWLEVLALPENLLHAGAICAVSDRLASLATLTTLPAGFGEGDRHTHHGSGIEEPLRSGDRESAYTVEGQKKGGSSSTLMYFSNLLASFALPY